MRSEHAERALAPALAADLEMRELEALGERRAHEEIQVRRDAADDRPVRPEQQNNRFLHAAPRRPTTGAGSCRPSQP
jgi:hypothetical protein